MQTFRKLRRISHSSYQSKHILYTVGTVQSSEGQSTFYIFSVIPLKSKGGGGEARDFATEITRFCFLCPRLVSDG